jgi:hypothetical protein
MEIPPPPPLTFHSALKPPTHQSSHTHQYSESKREREREGSPQLEEDGRRFLSLSASEASSALYIHGLHKEGGGGVWFATKIQVTELSPFVQW